MEKTPIVEEMPSMKEEKIPTIEEFKKIYMDSIQSHLSFPLKRRNLSLADRIKLSGTTYVDFVTNSEEESRAISDAIARVSLTQDIFHYQNPKYFGVDKADVYIIGDDLELHHELAFSSGYSWIGVKVDDKICAVSTTDYVCKRSAPETQLQPYALLKIAVAEMLGEKVSGDGPRLMLPRTAHHIPIAVVSAAPSGGLTGLNQEEFKGAQRAIEFIKDFLKKKSENGLSFSSLSYQEIKQLALCALSYLMRGKFNPNKITAQLLVDDGLDFLTLCPITICSWGDSADGQVRGINEKDVLEALNTLQLRSNL